MNNLTATEEIAEGLAEMVEETEVAEGLAEETESKWDETPYCFICSRCTCHIGEHEDEVAAGLAEYSEGLYVSWRDGVTREQIKAFYAAQRQG